MNEQGLAETFLNQYVQPGPLDYFILTNNQSDGPDWMAIHPAITDSFVYSPKGQIAIYSTAYLAEKLLKDIGTPLRLLCLSCFLHILRAHSRLRYGILDDKFGLNVMPWRAPCETTAVFRSGNQEFFIEGCRKSGVVWRSAMDEPIIEPPFISCGALDSNGGCWGEECPHGAYFYDECPPLRYPIPQKF